MHICQCSLWSMSNKWLDCHYNMLKNGQSRSVCFFIDSLSTLVYNRIKTDHSTADQSGQMKSLKKGGLSPPFPCKI